MQDSYKCISRVWLDFPTDFDNLSLCDDKKRFKNIFEEKKLYFNDYITKIIIIGDVSTGKSTIMNSLIGKDYFRTAPVNGTVSFFYCSQTEKDYEYFTINDDAEIKDFDLLKNIQGLDVILPDYIDHHSIFKVYIKNGVNKLLQKKTVIVDCPGFGHGELRDEQITHQCSTADIIIFIFNYDVPATIRQRNYIKDTRKQFKNPSCLFVYNHCDKIEFDCQKLISLKEDFLEKFNDLYYEGPRLSVDALYFVSAKYPDMGNDFKRLKTDILALVKVNHIRIDNVRSNLFIAINTFKESIRAFISLQRCEKTDLVKKLDEMNNESNTLNRKYSNLLYFVGNLIDECSKDFQMEKIFNVIFNEVKNHNATCTKHDANQFILNLANSIDEEIRENLINLLENRFISRINNKIEEIKKEKFSESSIIENIQLLIDKHFSFTITNMNINIFWPHEKGGKTQKVKEAYINFLQTEEIKNKITENVLKFYNDQLSKVKANIVESIEISKGKNSVKINQLHKNLKNKEDLLELLENYENMVLEFINSYKASLY